MVVVGDGKLNHIPQPQEIEYAVEHHAFHIRQPVEDAPVLGRQQDVEMLSQAESHERSRPSDALMIQFVPFGWHIGHTDRIFGEYHLVASLAELLRDVSVESRSYVPESHFLQCLALESAKGTRNDVVDTQGAGYGSAHLYSLQVFKCLER